MHASNVMSSKTFNCELLGKEFANYADASYHQLQLFLNINKQNSTTQKHIFPCVSKNENNDIVVNNNNAKEKKLFGHQLSRLTMVIVDSYSCLESEK